MYRHMCGLFILGIGLSFARSVERALGRRVLWKSIRLLTVMNFRSSARIARRNSKIWQDFGWVLDSNWRIYYCFSQSIRYVYSYDIFKPTDPLIAHIYFNLLLFQTHADIHKDTTYVCPHCGLQLNTKRTLKMHMVVHSDQKKYKCQYCGNEYKRSKALKVRNLVYQLDSSFFCIV